MAEGDDEKFFGLGGDSVLKVVRVALIGGSGSGKTSLVETFPESLKRGALLEGAATARLFLSARYGGEPDDDVLTGDPFRTEDGRWEGRAAQVAQNTRDSARWLERATLRWVGARSERRESVESDAASSADAHAFARTALAQFAQIDLVCSPADQPDACEPVRLSVLDIAGWQSEALGEISAGASADVVESIERIVAWADAVILCAPLWRPMTETEAVSAEHVLDVMETASERRGERRMIIARTGLEFAIAEARAASFGDPRLSAEIATESSTPFDHALALIYDTAEALAYRDEPARRIWGYEDPYLRRVIRAAAILRERNRRFSVVLAPTSAYGFFSTCGSANADLTRSLERDATPMLLATPRTVVSSGAASRPVAMDWTPFMVADVFLAAADARFMSPAMAASFDAANATDSKRRHRGSRRCQAAARARSDCQG